MENQLKAKFIKSDALIEVKIGAIFYEQLKELYFWYINLHGTEKCLESLRELVNRNPQNDLEKHLLTIAALLVEIETKGDQQGLLEDREVVPEKP